MGCMVNATPPSLYPWNNPGTHCIEGWVGPRNGLGGCEKSLLQRDSISNPSSPVASRYTDWAMPAHQCKRVTKRNYQVQYAISGLFFFLVCFLSNWKVNIPIVKPIRCTVSNLFYFLTTLYMFRKVSPCIIRSLRLYIQNQVYVKQILLTAF
jgi:hypothetical protein